MRKQLLFTALFIHSLWRKHVAHILTSCILGFLLTLLTLHTYPLFKRETRKHAIIGVVGKFGEDTLPVFIQNQISVGLTALTREGEATPSLAISWEASESGKTYEFTLRSGIQWHDGKPFTAEDVSYSWKGVSFTLLSPLLLRVNLEEPYVPLPVLLSKPLLRPNMTGLGLYKVAKRKYKETELSELTLIPVLPEYPRITYRFYPTVHDAILAFKLGEVDELKDLPETGGLENWPNVTVTQSTRFDRFVGIFFNLKNDMFKEKEIRHALSYAMPTFEGVQKSLTPISPLSWAYSQKIRLYDPNVPVAQKILSKSPIASESAEITLSTFPSLLSTAQKVAESWNSVGLRVKVRVEQEVPLDFEMFLLARGIPPDPDQYQYWQSTQEGTNLAHYSNPKIDKLLEDGRKTMDKEERKKIYADFQRYLVDDAPVIFLYHPNVYTVKRK